MNSILSYDKVTEAGITGFVNLMRTAIMAVMKLI